jgi:hypothetical protein
MGKDDVSERMAKPGQRGKIKASVEKTSAGGQMERLKRY